MDLPELIQGDERSKWIADSNHNVKCFTEEEVKRITNNYKTLLGRGASGEVYEGVLEDKGMVAVKRFILNVKENFIKELIVHSEINHKNVVRLIGYCLEENALMMITEHIPKGNLDTVLHHGEITVSLDTRLKIAVECAEALGYMHSQMYTQVIHGDIKPANILLDDKYNAKVSDFGISRLVNTDNSLYTMHVIGSIGYMDPLFARSGRLTAMSDVYSFGVVLLELITRKKARTDDGEIGLVDSFTEALAKGIRRVTEMFDAEIATSSDMKTIEDIAKLAAKCLRMEIHKRPEMLEVAEKLRALRKARQERKERFALFSWVWKNSADTVESRRALKSNPGPSERSSGSGNKNKNKNKNTGIVSFGSSSTALRVDLDDVLRASADLLGTGFIGTTYKARLESGDTLVIKKLRDHSFLSEAKFERCITAIGAIQNEHVVALRGYYYSKYEVLLLYDNMPMGSLSAALHGNQVSCPVPLDWGKRLAIALAVALGLASIHSAGPSSCHGNVKSSNVMLTGAYTARLTEHGLTTLVNPQDYALVGRQSGYLAPDLSISHKADVYSFGILLLELLTGKNPRVYWDNEKRRCHLLRWVVKIIREEWTVDVLDAELRKEGREEDEEGMLDLLKIALCCCCARSPDSSRLAMVDIVAMIEEIRGE